MERKKRPPSGRTSSEDTVLVQFTTKGLPKDSPEFQDRVNRPRSERGPNLARLKEAESNDDEPPVAD